MKPYLSAAAVALTLLTLSACGSQTPAETPSDGGLKVVADVYPVAYVAQQVGGDAVSVTTLTPPGVEPHDLELSAAQVKEIAAADVILYVPGMVPALDAAIAQQAPDKAVDVTAGIDRTGLTPDQAADPHVWLDPANMPTLGATTAAAIDKVKPGTSQTQKFDDAMAELVDSYSTTLADCAIDPLVVSHEAFGWLARAYGFTQHGISGLSPEAEPSPARMREITDLVRDQGVTTIYFEALVSDRAAAAIAAETGAQTALLDPIEGATNGATYPELMSENLEALKVGQKCQ